MMTSQAEPEAVASASLDVYDYDTDDGGNPSDEVAKSENVSASAAVAVKKESEYDYDTDDGDGGGKPAASSTSATSMSNTETSAEKNDGSGIKLKRPLSEISSGTPGAQTKSKSQSNGTQDENIITSYDYEIALIKDGERQFYSSMKVIPRRDKFRKCDPLSQPSLNSNALWCITIGDLVCVQHPSSHSLNAPFTTSWRPCQILSLFRQPFYKKGSNSSTRKKKWGAMKMEVRWLYRINDLDDRTSRYEKTLLKKQSSNKQKTGGRRNDGEEEELFETGHVEILYASVLLGRLVLKHNHDVGKVKNDAAKYPVPTVVKFCHRYYLHKEQDIFDIFDWENMMTRGLECSEMNENVTRKALQCLSLTTSRSDNTKEIGDDPHVILPCHTETVKQKEPLYLFYTSCTLAYPWSQMKHSNLLCHPEKRVGFPKWELCVGDVIAVHSESTPPSGTDDIQGRDKWYPYRVPWSHAQVISIYRATISKSDTLHNERVSVDGESITVDIRWFPRVSEAIKEGRDKKAILKMLEQISDDRDRMCEEILEGEQSTTIDCSSILGPVFIDDGNVQNCAVSPCCVPKNRRTVSKRIRCDKRGVPFSCLYYNWINIDPSSRVHRGTQISKYPKNKQKKAILLEAVLKVRDQRAKRLIHEQSRVAMKGEIVESEPVQGFAGDIAAEPDGNEQSPHKKCELFSSGVNVIDECKKLRTSADGEPFHKAPRDAMTSESVVKRTLQENLAGEGHHHHGCGLQIQYAAPDPIKTTMMTSQVEPEAVASASLNVYDYDTDDGGNPSDEVAKSENVSASAAVAVKKESEYDYDTDDGHGGGNPAASSTSATSMSNTETLTEKNDGSGIKLKRPLSEISSGLTWGWGIPPLVKPPSHLPQAESLLEFDVNQKKNDIFEAVRERVRSKAQYTKSGRKPWTQITATLPIKSATTSDDEDLAVVWALMRESTNDEVKENAKGDVIWTIWHSDHYLKWLNIDPDKTKPVNKFVHPVLFETGARKQTMLENKIKKARNAGNFFLESELETELEEYQSAQAAKKGSTENGKEYHWSTYDECIVTYKKKQTRKSVKELQLTVKVRTSYLGSGDPKENNGYLRCSDCTDVLDPEGKVFTMLKSILEKYK